MALSGNIEKVIRTGYNLGIDWKVNSQSASSNSSNVTATVYLRSTGSSYTISSSAAKDVSITIDGVKYLSTCTVGISGNAKKNLFSKTVTVKHNSDGSKTCDFACGLDINVTLGGTYYGKQTASGSGAFNKINLNSPPVLGGSISVSPNGIISENQGSLSLNWNAASDTNNNLQGYKINRYVNGSLNGSYTTSSNYYTDSIGNFGQGTTFQYKIYAYDTQNANSGEISSPVVTKNKFTGAKLTSNINKITWGTNELVLSIGGASNTNGNSDFTYQVYSDDITIYNQRQIKITGETLKIWDGIGDTPSTPYIKKSDLINKFRGDVFVGSIKLILRTTNAYSTQTTNNLILNVDLKTEPVKPFSVEIVGGSALKTIATTGIQYYIPNGKDTIEVNWVGGYDKLGGAHTYRIIYIVDGVEKEVGSVDANTTSCELILPKLLSTKQLSVRVCTTTTFGVESYRDSMAVTLHYYNDPTIEVGEIERTDTTATANLKLSANTSIPNVNFPTRSFSGVSTGTLLNTQETQKITATGLKGGDKYLWNINIMDDTGLQNNVVIETIEISAYTPLFSVREQGVGVNVIPGGEYAFEVKGDTNINGNLLVNGKPFGTGDYIEKSEIATKDAIYGKIPKIGADGVMEVGKYLDFHDGSGSTVDYDARVICNGNWLETTAMKVGSVRLTGQDIKIHDKRALVGFTDGNLEINYNQDFGVRTKVNGRLDIEDSANTLNVKGGSSNHCFIGIYPRSDKNIRGSFIGYGSSGTNTLSIQNSLGNIDLSTSSNVTCGKLDVSQWVQTKDFWLLRDGRIISSYNNDYFIGDHNNGNITVSAAGGQLFLGYRNTSSFNISYCDTWDVGASSGTQLKINKAWSGSSGTEISIYQQKGKGWGFLGNTNNSWFRVYGAGGSVSARESKYDIQKYDTETLYNYVKELNVYGYRSISDSRDENDNVIEIHKRSDLCLGTMVDELPLETTFYDGEGGNGKAVDMYSYTTMILGATKVLQQKVELLEKENEILIERLNGMEEKINGSI
ncbi:MAG: hypothetical protein RSH78_00165 [Bacilli bacterium]